MVDPKVILLVAFVTTLSVQAHEEQIVTNVSDTSNKQIIYNKPIVIHTQLDNYEQPTLREYQECHENAQKCLTVCKGVSDVESCEKQCPICPELIREEKVVQGVNDTFAVPQQPPLNTTNIIRLTNEIHNIIDNSRGNITFRNENVMHVHQNISRVGGKFGLGYKGTDPCCIILNAKKQCDAEKFSTAARCHRKRHRVCGPQCKARVMMTKVVMECEQPDPLDYFEEKEDTNCHQTVKYIPYRQRRSSYRENRCNPLPYWPFVACPQNQHRPIRGDNCGGCLRLPYAFILRNGIPLQCQTCFSSLGGPAYGYVPYPPSPPVWYPPSMFDSPVIDNDFDFDTTGDWTPDKVKCISADGTVIDDCPQIEGSADDTPVTQSPPIVDDYDEDNDFDFTNDHDFIRRRRQTFKRSKYSRRHRRE